MSNEKKESLAENEITPTVFEKPAHLNLSATELLEQVTLVQQIYKKVMKEKVHFGTIPGCKQPSLYKAGSEKLILVFRFAVEPVVEDLSTDDEIRYRVSVRLTRQKDGMFIGSGIGECSSSEDKYRWRGVVCDGEYDDTLEDRRRIKYQKTGWDHKNKCNFFKRVKQVRTSPADLANTILKMAKKRGQIDAVLTNTGASDVFTQDLEDLEEKTRESILGHNGKTPKSGKPDVAMPEKKSESKPSEKKDTPPVKKATDGDKLITEKQVYLIGKKCEEKALNMTSDVLTPLGIKKLEELPRGEVDKVLEYIKNF